jgi:antitoxin MazE
LGGILAERRGGNLAERYRIIPIGNSLGIRLPKNLLQKYGLIDLLVLEETDQGLLLRKKDDDKLSWSDTYKAMANEDEDWSDYDPTLLDGLEDDDFDKS